MGNNGVPSKLNEYFKINHLWLALVITNLVVAYFNEITYDTFQVVASYMMIMSLNKKGYNGFALSVPSPSDLLEILGLAAPVFVMMMSKVY